MEFYGLKTEFTDYYSIKHFMEAKNVDKKLTNFVTYLWKMNKDDFC